MILVKDLTILNLHSKLIEIATWVMESFDLSVVTSAYRPGDKGVHGQLPCRGLDLRCRNKVVGTEVMKRTNEKWVYDPERLDYQVCVAHDQGNGYHIHLQVHPNTQLRG